MDTSVVQEDENATKDSVHENEEAPCKEEVFSPRVFVNTRRGKGNGTKRKISEPAKVTEFGTSIPPGAAEVQHIMTFPTLAEVRINEQICIMARLYHIPPPPPYCHKYAKLILDSLCMAYFDAILIPYVHDV